MTQPNRPQQRIIPFLVQEKLARVSEPRVYFAVFVDVGRYHPGARGVVEVEDAAFADVDVEAYVLLAPVFCKLEDVAKDMREDKWKEGELTSSYAAAHHQSTAGFHSQAHVSDSIYSDRKRSHRKRDKAWDP